MGLTGCFRQLVRDCEFLRMIKCIQRGIRFDEESLALDVIKEIGSSGTYLCHANTARLARSSQSAAGLIDRRNWSDWQSGGAQDINDRAYAKAAEILKNHHACGLSGDAANLIKKIAAAGEKQILG